METFINKKQVKINSEIGRWTSLAALAVLIGGMIVSIVNPALTLVSLLCLVVGFIGSTVGAYYANHWTRSPRADEVLDQELKGISNQYHIYHYLLPSSHVLLGPVGLFLLRVYTQEGDISFDGRKWKHKSGWLSLLGFTGQDALGDPTRDMQDEARRFEAWLRKRIPAEQMPEMIPLVVFVRERARLSLPADMPLPVLPAGQLKRYIRNTIKERREALDEDALYEIERAMVGSKIDEL